MEAKQAIRQGDGAEAQRQLADARTWLDQTAAAWRAVNERIPQRERLTSPSRKTSAAGLLSTLDPAELRREVDDLAERCDELIAAPNTAATGSTTSINSTWPSRTSTTRKQKPEARRPTASANAFIRRFCKSFTRLLSERRFTKPSKNCKPISMSGSPTTTKNGRTAEDIATAKRQRKPSKTPSTSPKKKCSTRPYRQFRKIGNSCQVK